MLSKGDLRQEATPREICSLGKALRFSAPKFQQLHTGVSGMLGGQ